MIDNFADLAPPDPEPEDEGVILLVTGSRSITSQQVVDACLDKFPQRVRLLIHGGAVGVDTCAGIWAKARGIAVRVVRPDFAQWPREKYKNKAFTVRDQEMVHYAERVVAIWDGQSSGTRLTFEYAKEFGKLHCVHRC